MASSRPTALPLFSAFASASFVLFLASAASANPVQPPSSERPVETPPSPPAALNQPATTPESPKAETPRKRFRFGPEVGLYLPTNSRTRDRFGSAWTNIGFGIGNIADIHRSRRLALDINLISNSRGDAKVFLAPIGLAYSVGLGKQESRTASYAGASANLVIASIRSDSDKLPSRTSATAGGAVFVGTRFSESGYVEARYNLIAKVRTFDLSGLNLTAGFRF